MAAETIASELKLNPCKIDLSSILSNYIGETEKILIDTIITSWLQLRGSQGSAIDLLG
jgi:SpoVK/Ycf46/Vps4 family AAA+-type ATPase